MNRPRSQRLWPLAVPLLCLASMLAIVPAICAQLVRTPTPASTIPHTYFGMHIHGMVTPRPGNTRPAGWPTVPFGSWRLLAAYVDWPQLEPARGQWNFAALDRYLQLAEQHHVEVLLPLVLSPAWASSRPNEKSSYSPGNAAPPANLDDWQTYVRTVATRYKGRISDYEIWNEPSVRTFFSGTPDEMVALTREASRILKEVDPRNVVVSPSAAEGGTSWLDQFLAAGGGKYVNVIGYHFYVRHDPEAMVPAHWAKVKEYASGKGLHLETGTGAVLPKSPADFDASVANLRTGIQRAKASRSSVGSARWRFARTSAGRCARSPAGASRPPCCSRSPGW